jgi:ribosome-binding ATPase YchF (GTP1/OBG family)
MSATWRCPIRAWRSSWRRSPARRRSSRRASPSSTSPAWCAAPPRAKGLGNQFLANIRECDAIAHVLRCFEDGDITHVEGKIDPVADIETIETELMLADLESLEKRVSTLEKKPKAATRKPRNSGAMMNRCLVLRAKGKPARCSPGRAEERKAWRLLGC